MAEDEEFRTADPERIRQWVEDRNGTPAITTENNGEEELLFTFPGKNIDLSHREIGWDEFFEEFDQRGLMFIYGEEFEEPGQDRPPEREKYQLVRPEEEG